jgi:hypothetical protein
MRINPEKMNYPITMSECEEEVMDLMLCAVDVREAHEKYAAIRVGVQATDLPWAKEYEQKRNALTETQDAYDCAHDALTRKLLQIADDCARED